ncbi:MAG: class I SAM-dependent methyltransferase [Promethearchaeota archaeon]
MKVRIYLWYFFRRTNLDTTWFKEFSEYAYRILFKERKIVLPFDVFYYKNLLNPLIEDLTLPETDDCNVILNHYQKPEFSIVHLLHLISKESYFFYHNVLKLLHKIKKKRKVLEFGCASAPITTKIFEFYKPSKKNTYYISDIETLPFHYASYLFRHCSNVKPIILKPEDDFKLSIQDKIDVILCITVFEHLNKPLETVKIFHKILNKGGHLIFDFIIPVDAFDTIQAKNERESVLDFILENFIILHGNIDRRKKVNLTVARKK